MLTTEVSFPTYTDTIGQPLQGSVYFGTTGQNPITSPATVYWDSAGTQPVRQPVSCVNGFAMRNGAPARVWVSGDYSRLVRDSAGRQVLYEPSVFPLSGASGSSAIGFQQPGTGAAIRTAEGKMRDIVALSDAEGADPTGATSSYTAFANVVSWLGTNGGDIYLGVGDWLLDVTPWIAKSGVHLRGSSPLSTRLINGTTNGAAVQFGDGSNTYTRCAISSMAIAQSGAVVAVAGNCGLYAVNQSNFYMRDVQMFNFPASLYQGAVLNNVSQSYVSGLGVQNCLNHGVYTKNNCLDLYLMGCRSDANGASGWVFEDSSGLYPVACTAFNNTDHGFLVQTAGPSTNVFHFYTNCVADTSGSHNWEITQLSVGSFSNCWGSTQQSATVNTTAAGFHANGVNVSDLAFNGCIALGNNGHGYDIVQAHKVTIDSPVAGTSALTGGPNGKGGAGSGIHVGASAERVTITSGSAEGNVSYGVDIDAGAIDVDVMGTNLKFNTAGAARNSANGTAAQAVFRFCRGLNPQLNAVTNPAVPASTVVFTNKTGYDCDVYISSGTVSEIDVAGSFVFSASPASVFLPHGATVTLTYTVAPIWKWIAR